MGDRCEGNRAREGALNHLHLKPASTRFTVNPVRSPRVASPATALAGAQSVYVLCPMLWFPHGNAPAEIWKQKFRFRFLPLSGILASALSEAEI